MDPIDVTNAQYRNMVGKTFPATTPNYDDIMERVYPMLYPFPPGNWYQLTYAPMNKYYDTNVDYFKTKRFIDTVRRRHTDSNVLILSREIDAAKYHINVLCHVPKGTDYVKMFHNETWDRKCNIHCQLVRPNEQDAVARYIFKEARARPFIEYLDYYLYEIPIPGEAVRPCVEHNWFYNDTHCPNCIHLYYTRCAFVEA